MHGKRAGVQRFMDGSCDLCTETLYMHNNFLVFAYIEVESNTYMLSHNMYACRSIILYL